MPNNSQLEAVRRRFLPEKVSVLFVGESPPAGGTFFYLANSKLYNATKEAFRLAVPDLVRGPNFLGCFSALGCYLDDLCLEPVNHLKLDNPLAKAKRLRLRKGEAPLAARLADYAPGCIIVVMKGIENNVREAVELARLASVPTEALPFPARKEHRERYVDELASLLKQTPRTLTSQDPLTAIRGPGTHGP